MMKRKYYIVGLILCLALIFNFSTVKAAEKEEVTDREMAVASAMSYAPLRNGKTMAQCFDIAGIKSISKIVNYVNGKFNLHDYATLKEVDDWKVEGYSCLQGIRKNGLTTFKLVRDNDVIIVIRGSNSPTDAFDDIRYGITNSARQEKYIKEYIQDTLDQYAKKDGIYNFYITGHSLGGYLAQIGGAYIEDTVNSNEKYKNLKLARIVDFNGMGINYLTALGKYLNYGNKNKIIETLKKIGQDGRLIEYYTYGDVVSSLGVHYGELRELTPSIDSITYHRNTWVGLGTLGSKIFKIAEADTIFNGCKTDLSNSQKFYKVGNLGAYLNLTHEADTFATIDVDKSVNEPVVKVTDQNACIANFLDGVNKNTYKKSFTIRTDRTLRAVTAYASAKKYEWYEKVNGDWKLIKTSTIDKKDPNYDPTAKVTNELRLTLNDFKIGETKEFMVKSYYNDNYTASEYYINKKGQYAYKEKEGASKQEESKVVTETFKVKRSRTSKILNNLFARMKK